MAILVKLILVVYGLSLSVDANQHWWKVNPVILSEKETSACSLQQKQGLKTIEARVNASLSNVYQLSQCGDGPWYKVACLNMSDPTQSCPSNCREYHTTIGRLELELVDVLPWVAQAIFTVPVACTTKYVDESLDIKLPVLMHSIPSACQHKA